MRNDIAVYGLLDNDFFCERGEICCVTCLYNIGCDLYKQCARALNELFTVRMCKSLRVHLRYSPVVCAG